MSKIGSLFGKKKRKEKEEQPSLFNGLYSFNNQNIVMNSQTSEEILHGSSISDTLFLETDTKPSSFSFIFVGNNEINLLSQMKSRLIENFPPSLIFSALNKYESMNEKMPFIEIPDKNLDDQTFFQGNQWYLTNKDSIEDRLSRLIRDASLVFIFVENNAFLLGMMQPLLKFIENTKTQPVLVLNLPVDEAPIDNTVSILAFIHQIMKKEEALNIPFILLDGNILLKANPNLNLIELSSKFTDRIANIFCDIILGALTPSTFYQTDLSNFIRIFENVRGPCNLVSFDIYDNKPKISNLLEQKQLHGSSFSVKNDATRGLIVIQPCNKGISTKEYRNLRDRYANLDVNISILENRNNGSIIRG
ncbi:MAG: hypothetical protein KAQ70_02890, partial [Candidatus Heimdallarchaeota archaeon]|nr:hypothetical protein [Candidatus Heimdallarchaeota archaeon]